MLYFSLQGPLGQLSGNLGQFREYPANTGNNFKLLKALVSYVQSLQAVRQFVFILFKYFLLAFLAEITDFQTDQTFQGFSYDNGRLKVQEHGSYYIYAQAFFQSRNTSALHNRVALTINGAAFSLLQTGLGGQADYGSLYTGGVIPLQQDDYISLVTVYDSYLWVASEHTFFGAYRIEQQSTCLE